MKQKALYITGKLFPVNSGDAIYSYGNLDRIAEHFAVDVLMYTFNDDFREEEAYRKLIARVQSIQEIEYAPSKLENIWKILRHGDGTQKYTEAMKRQLDRTLAEKTYDVIFMDHLCMFFLYSIIKKRVDRTRTKLILIEHNIEHANIKQEIRFTKSRFKRWKSRLLHFGIKDLEQRAIRQADYIWSISEQDKRMLQELGKEQRKIQVIPPYYAYAEVKQQEQMKQPSHTLLLLGSMDWYPNVMGALWFIEHVFKPLKEQDSRYRLYIVGNHPTPDLRRYHGQEIIVTGGVKSVDDYIALCDFLIVPNFLGGGAKIKILEGIMKGIPILATKESTIGYPQEVFPHDFCANQPDEFLHKIMELNGNFEKKRQFIEQGRKAIQNTWDIRGMVRELMS